MRYHARRLAWFETLHRFTALLTVSVAGFVFLEASGVQLPQPLRWLSLVAGVLAIFDFVVSYSQRADQHRHLRRRFCELEVEMVMADDGDDKRWKELVAARLHIEIDEPPMYRALDLLCHNEQAIADGHKPDTAEGRQYLYKLLWRQRVTAHFLHWDNIGSDPRIKYPT